MQCNRAVAIVNATARAVGGDTLDLYRDDDVQSLLGASLERIAEELTVLSDRAVSGQDGRGGTVSSGFLTRFFCVPHEAGTPACRTASQCCPTRARALWATGRTPAPRRPKHPHPQTPLAPRGRMNRRA